LSRSTNVQPKNESIPLNFSIPLKASPANLNGRVLRIATWNVASLATRMKKGFKIYFPREDADIWILTETKTASPTMEPTITTRYPYRYFSINAKKSGYAGVAVFSRLKPVSKPSHVIPAPYHPDPESTRGRIVTLEFEDFWLVGTYVVNAGENLKFMDNKLVWMRSFEAYIRQLDKSKPVIWGGDVNIAPTALDIAEASKRWNKRPGYTEQELKAWNSLVGGAQDGSHKLIDVWRNLHPELQHYSFWDYRTRQRSTGLGWRLDMFLLSDRIAGQTRACEIRDEIYTSDHCPVVLDVEL
ncbi:Endonuclease/exonuclease/phosphatase, partial [Auriculariales sp. MPI-PUGE-AT-0066]